MLQSEFKPVEWLPLYKHCENIVNGHTLDNCKINYW